MKTNIIRLSCGWRIAVSSAYGLVLLVCSALAQPSPTPQAHFWQPDNEVYAVAAAPGVVYLGGVFNYVGPQSGKAGVIELASGRVPPFPKINGPVYAVLSDGGGGWFLGGDFEEVGGTRITNLVHVLSDCRVDAQWNPRPDNSVLSLARSGNTLYVGGNFQRISDKNRPYLAAVETVAGEALDWAPQANSTVHTLNLAGSILYVGGSFTTINKVQRSGAAALDITLATNWLTAWNPSTSGGSKTVYALAVAENTVYAGGDFLTIGGKPRNRIAALDATTGLATTWNPNANELVRAVVVSGNTVFVGGDFTSVGTRSRYHLAALDKAGLGGAISTWDANLENNNTSASCLVAALAVADSTLYVAGKFGQIADEVRRGVAALDIATGQLKPWNPQVSSLSPSLKSTVWSLALDDTSACVGGDFNSLGGFTRNRLAALDTVSGAAKEWNPSAGNAVYALAVSSNVVFAGGVFTNIGTAARSRIASLDATTGEVTAWDPKAVGSGSSGIYCFHLSSNILYAGGLFTQIGGQPNANLAAFDIVTGQIKSDWKPAPNQAVYALGTDSNLVYVGGQFDTIGGASRPNLAAVDTITGKATAWAPKANGTVRSLAVGADTIYAAGDFSGLGGETRNRIGSVEKTTGIATIWAPDAGGQGQLRVYSLAPVGSFMYLGGLFGSVGGEFRNRLASLDLLMGVAVAWNPNPDLAVRSIAFADGRIFVGGEFTKFDKLFHPYFAAFSMGSCFDLATLKRMPNGDIQCRVNDGGCQWPTLLIQASTNLIEWTTISTSAVTGFPIDFTDAEAGQHERRFYRAVTQP